MTFGGTNVSRLHKPSAAAIFSKAAAVAGGVERRRCAEKAGRRERVTTAGFASWSKARVARGAPREAWGSGGGKGAPPGLLLRAAPRHVEVDAEGEEAARRPARQRTSSPKRIRPLVAPAAQITSHATSARGFPRRPSRYRTRWSM